MGAVSISSAAGPVETQDPRAASNLQEDQLATTRRLSDLSAGCPPPPPPPYCENCPASRTLTSRLLILTICSPARHPRVPPGYFDRSAVVSSPVIRALIGPGASIPALTTNHRAALSPTTGDKFKQKINIEIDILSRFIMP